MPDQTCKTSAELWPKINEDFVLEPAETLSGPDQEINTCRNTCSDKVDSLNKECHKLHKRIIATLKKKGCPATMYTHKKTKRCNSAKPKSSCSSCSQPKGGCGCG